MVKPGYKQTDLGLLPEEWACREIGSFADVCMCKRIFAEQTSEMGEIPFYKIGTFGKKADAYISRPLFEEYKQKYSYPQKGDVLISAAGTLGRTVVYDGEEAYFQDSNIVWLDIDKSQISNDYLYHYYKVIKWTPSEGSTIARLYNGIITSTNVAVPPKPEQKAIAEALSDIDTLIVNLDKLIAKKEAVRNGTLQRMITGRVRLEGFSGEWVEINMAKHSKLKARIGWQGLTTSEYLSSGDAILVTGTDFCEGRVKWDSCHFVSWDRYQQDPNIQIVNGDVLLTKDGTIGKVALVDSLNRPATLNSGVFVIRPLKNAYSSRFLYYVLASSVFQEFLDKLVAGSTIVHLYQKDLVAFEFMAPPTYEEQEAIASVLYDMDGEIQMLKEKLGKYKLIKQGMMSELFTGRMRLV